MASNEWFEYRALRRVCRAHGSVRITDDWSGLVAARQRLIMTGYLTIVWSGAAYVCSTVKGRARYEELDRKFSEGR
jgi:hypothetical protein